MFNFSNYQSFMKQFFRSFALLVAAVLVSVSGKAAGWNVPEPNLQAISNGDTVYLYNVGAKGFLSMGEAWGTQAIIGTSAPLQTKAQLQDSTLNTWKIWTSAKGGKHLFRTNSDAKIGDGVKGCFADGGDAKNVWTILPIAEGAKVYTIQMVNTDADSALFDANLYLGTQLDHTSGAGTDGITHGAYFDVNTDTLDNIHWGFVSLNDMKVYNAKVSLVATMTKAAAKKLDVTAAEAVLNNVAATLEEVEAQTAALNQAIANVVTPDDPVDVTETYLGPNYNFNSSHADWTSTMIASNDNEPIQNNAQATNRCTDEVANVYKVFDGSFWENWDPSAYTGKMHKVAKGIPSGVYQASLAAFVNTWDAENAFNKKQYVFFNDQKVLLRSALNEKYTAMVVIDADTLDIGFAQDSAIANWAGIDNAKLMYFGNGIEAYQYMSTHNTEVLASDYADHSLFNTAYYDAVVSAIDAAKTTTTVADAIAAYAVTKDALEALRLNKEEYAKLDKLYLKLYSAVLTEGVPGLDALFDEVEENVTDKQMTNEELAAYVANVQDQITKAYQSSYNAGDDVTEAFVVNAAFETSGSASTKGWNYSSKTGTNAGGGSSGVIEVWNGDFDCNQTLTGLKNGVYTLSVQGYYRTTNENAGAAWTAWTAANGENTGDNTVRSYIYINSATQPLANIFSWNSATQETGMTANGADPITYEPNDVKSANTAFGKGADVYLNQVVGICYDRTLKIGIACSDPTAKVGRWTLWNDFKLVYNGNDAALIAPVLQQLINKGTTLAESKMPAELKSALNAEIASATSEVSGTDGVKMMAAYQVLATAIDTAQKGADAYVELTAANANLTAAISKYAETAKEEVLTDATTLNAAVTAAVNDGTITVPEVAGKITEIDSVIFLLKEPKGEASDINPLDYSYLIANPDLTDAATSTRVAAPKGWTIETKKYGKKAAGCDAQFSLLEGYNGNFDIYQDIKGLKKGVYQVVCTGASRDSSSAYASACFAGDSTNLHVYIFANGDSALLQNVIPSTMLSDESWKAAEGAAGLWTSYLDTVTVAGDTTTYFYPLTREAAYSRVVAGYYGGNSVYCYVGDAGFLRLGFFNHEAKGLDWAFTTGWKLYYLGDESSHKATTGINGVTADDDAAATVSETVYTVDGRQIAKRQRGVNIVRSFDANGKVTVKKVVVE